MKSLFDNPRAFAPMFTEWVTIGGESYRASVSPGAMADPLSDVQPTSETPTISVLIPKEGAGSWNKDALPSVGDSLVWNDENYTITARDRFITDLISLEAKGC